jgi:mono/diheme cytochrome c family protein
MRNAVLVSLLPLMLCAAAPVAVAADAQRGRELYESNCSECHSESVHGRAKRVAGSFEEIAGWVLRWSTHLKLKWGAPEIEDVSAFLNNTYYRYACPPTVCKVTSMRSSEARGRS